ncbi:glycosyltransferase family 4 protein [Alistipes sp.]|uniref:glycosyltransferase family 4 protein n=1 Tax=Alistipes sp. TaxID=1872444 RepID=UPI0025BE0AD6|nr:glycosyltransferase family 4 protein [Alistipes sp.]
MNEHIMSKTIFFHNNNDFTGSTRVLANVIETEYAKQSVTVVSMNTNDGFLSSLANVHIVSVCYPLFKNKRIPFLSGLIFRLHAFFIAFVYGWRYDVFYINTIKPFYAAIVGAIYHKKIIYHIHEKYVTNSFNVKLLEFVFNHVPAKRIFVSKYVKEQYPSQRKSESIVMYNSLSTSFLSKVKIVPIEQRKRNVIIMISSLQRGKGIFTYIDIARKMPEYKFLLILSTDIGSIKCFFKCEIPSNIEFIPSQIDIHPFLRMSDLMMNLSIPSLCIETFGMTILEAMAYGIPSIVPNVGGPTELIKDGYNGFCIDVSDVDQIVHYINKALEQNEYGHLAQNSLERLKLFV